MTPRMYTSSRNHFSKQRFVFFLPLFSTLSWTNRSEDTIYITFCSVFLNPLATWIVSVVGQLVGPPLWTRREYLQIVKKCSANISWRMNTNGLRLSFLLFDESIATIGRIDVIICLIRIAACTVSLPVLLLINTVYSNIYGQIFFSEFQKFRHNVK